MNGVQRALVAVLGVTFAAAPGAALAQPVLSLPPCGGAPAGAGDTRCVDVTLDARGAAVASAGIVLRYDTRRLRLEPSGVTAGPSLADGQQLVALVDQDLQSGAGKATIIVAPPIVVPSPVLRDQLAVAALCFTVPADPVAGCAALTFGDDTDLGDPGGNNIPLGTLSPGGVLLACSSAAACDDGDACTTDGCGTDGICVHEPLCGGSTTTTTGPSATSTTTTVAGPSSTTSTTVTSPSSTTSTTAAPTCHAVRCALDEFAGELETRNDLGTLHAWLVERVRHAARQAQEAETNPRRRRRLLRAAVRSMKRVERRLAGRAGRKLGPDVQAELLGRCRSLRAALADQV